LQWQRRGIREPSFEIKTEWEVITEFSKQRFDKLPNLIPGVVGTETTAGRLHAFDSTWDRLRMMKSKKLPSFKGLVPNESTTNDPIIQRLANEGKA
jgi:Eukaryotic translation initiation factor 3 subunit 7 (eIF-3)